MATKHPVLAPAVKPARVLSGKTKGETRKFCHAAAAIRLDKNGVVDSWSAAAGRVTGLTSAVMVGRRLDAICIGGNLARTLDAIRGDPVEIVLALDCGARGIVRAEANVSARRDSAGMRSGFDLDFRASGPPESAGVGLVNGVTPGPVALRELKIQDSAAFLVDGRTLRILDSNPAASLALGQSSREMMGRVLPEILNPGHNLARRDMPGDGGACLSYLQLVGRNGAARSYGLSLVPVRSGKRDLALCVLHELTAWVSMDADRTALNEELARLARHDHLTGLFNRPMFQDTLEIANSRVDRSGGLMGVLYIDLDGFKKVNDRFGHDAGDALLVEIVRRLKSGLRSSDVIARLGGDEFGAILENLKKRDDALKVALNLIKCLKKPFEVEGECVQVSASIGAVVTARTVEDASALVAQADRTMYEVKSLERGRAALA
ncbi:MAG: diguanylate cyclase, partial [Alphaproteobacteria bacterium]|nr:diguanylate cyclase [Alphaproteobacteria bacterium]